MKTEDWPRLVADVGGTHVRFAWATAPQRLEQVQVWRVQDHPDLPTAIQAYRQHTGCPPVRHAAVAVAAPVSGDRIRLTNHPWAFSIAALQQALACDTLLVLNDFTAQAWAIPALPPAACVQIGGGTAVAGAPLAVIGPGSGLGVSGLLPDGRGGYTALAGEGGHAGFAPADDTETYVWQYARRRYGHVSSERLLSGAGLELIHAALAEQAGATAPQRTAAQISAAALDGSSPLCRQVWDTFCAMLGTAAANLALTLGARGGVYLCGGILPRWADAFPHSPFRRRFDSHGRMSTYLAAIPVYLVCQPHSGLYGAAAALDRHLEQSE